MFTQHNMGEHLTALILRAYHRIVQKGRVGIPQLLSIFEQWKETLMGREVDSQSPRGSSSQKGKGGFQYNSPEDKK